MLGFFFGPQYKYTGATLVVTPCMSTVTMWTVSLLDQVMLRKGLNA